MFMVAASVVIAMAGSFAALDLAGKARDSSPRNRFFWISAAALAFGAAVWSMHFVGMLAYQAPVPVTYDATLTALSLVAVLVTSWCGFTLAARRSTRWWTISVAGAVTGAGACIMHYTGMAGMQMPGQITYDPGLLAVSVLCALAASILAMWLAFRKLSILQSVVGAFILGSGVSGLHYIGMAAAHMEGMPVMAARPAVMVPRPMLAVLATLGAVSIFVWIIVGSLRDRWRAMQGFAKEQARYQSIVNTAVDPIVVSDEKGCVISFNAAAERAFGYMSGEIIGQNVSRLMPEMHQVHHDSYLERYRCTGERRVIGIGRVVEGRRKNGETFPVDLAIAEWWSGKERFYTAILRDRTERDEAERALRSSERRLALAIEASGGGVLEYPLPLSDELHVSLRTCEILGYQELPVRAQDFELWLREQIHPEDQAARRQIYGDFLEGRRAVYEMEMRLKHQKGHWIWVQVTAQAVERDASGAVRQVAAMIFDITSRKEAERKVEHLAFHDPLTQLPNRTLFNTRLTQAMSRARTGKTRVAVVMIDLGRFKEVNDTLGHMAGDELLKIVGQRISGAIRAGDTPARLGGDEFAVILNDVPTRQGLEMIVRRICTTLVQPIKVGDQLITIDAGLGVAIFPDDASNTHELLRRADLALYKAKEQVFDSDICYYEEDLSISAARRARVEADLRHAIEHHELRLFYQPQIELKTGEIRTLEALVRWEHPRHGLLLPGEFIPVAEKSGLIGPLGSWVMQEARRQQEEWKAQGLTARIAVNVSPAEIGSERFTQVLEAALDGPAAGEYPIELEITEGLLMDLDSPCVQQFLNTVASRNMGLALDDFGKGFSSLSYLARLPISKVKIDRSFVSRIGRDDDNTLVEAIVTLGHRLGKRVVAEGGETEAQHRFLTRVGCDDVQGYLYCPPVKQATMTSLLAEGTSLFSRKGFPMLV